MHNKMANIPLSKAFGEIINRLLLTTKNLTGQRWLITSALVGEGKTISAIGIAFTMVHRNKKVLLIDGNLRNPSISRRFGSGSPMGLTEVIQRGEDVKRVLHKARDMENLSVLAAGNLNIDPFELFRGQRIQEVLNTVQDLFDFTIIDSPALDENLDALLLAPYVEGCIIVMQAEKTRKSAVLKAGQEIEKVGGKVLGLIFNREKQRIPRVFHR